MSQSLSALFVHLVWSTKDRHPFINPEIASELHAYLAGICHELRCPPVEIGGWLDHVHVLCLLSRTLPVMTLAEKLKCNLSKWIKTANNDCRHFAWQGGYAAFSVGLPDADAVKQYIRNQPEHHKTKGFQEEMRREFQLHGIAYNEAYVWL